MARRVIVISTVSYFALAVVGHGLERTGRLSCRCLPECCTGSHKVYRLVAGHQAESCVKGQRGGPHPLLDGHDRGRKAAIGALVHLCHERRRIERPLTQQLKAPQDVERNPLASVMKRQLAARPLRCRRPELPASLKAFFRAVTLVHSPEIVEPDVVRPGAGTRPCAPPGRSCRAAAVAAHICRRCFPRA